jgi:hypothetical protein
VLSGRTCRTILAAHPAVASGIFQVDPDAASTANAFFAYCDMASDGGGWMKILQYASTPYTPTAAAIGTIAVAGTPGAAKLADADINALATVNAYREYRFQGATSTKKLFLRSNATWDDLARGHGLILTGAGQACEATTNCTYVTVTTPGGRPTIDSNDWSPSSIGGLNNEDRYFTDYDGVQRCFGWGGGIRCYNAGVTTGHAMIPNFSLWVREAALPGDAVAVYDLDENTGTAIADSSGHGYDAAIFNGSWTAGHNGSAIQGSLRTNGTLPGMTEGTFAAWVRRDSVGQFSFPRILSWNDGFEVADGAGQLSVHTFSTSWYGSGQNFGSGWHHIAVAAGGGTIVIYFDGVQVHSRSGSINLSAARVSVGVRHTGNESFNGAIDDVRIYNRALTAAEVQTLAEQ